MITITENTVTVHKPTPFSVNSNLTLVLLVGEYDIGLFHICNIPTPAIEVDCINNRNIPRNLIFAVDRLKDLSNG